MSSSRRGVVVAAGVAVVETLKDQVGLCRWNYLIRSAYQNAGNRLRSFSQAQKLSSPQSMAPAALVREEERMKQSEESLRKVMYLSCWGPN